MRGDAVSKNNSYAKATYYEQGAALVEYLVLLGVTFTLGAMSLQTLSAEIQNKFELAAHLIQEGGGTTRDSLLEEEPECGEEC